MAKILLIEDDGALRAALKAALEHAGHQVVEANGGREGLAVYERQLPDVTVLDRDMPGGTGWDTFVGIRHMNNAAKIVVWTGMVHGRTKYEQLGVNAYLTKTTTLPKVLRAIEDLARA